MNENLKTQTQIIIDYLKENGRMAMVGIIEELISEILSIKTEPTPRYLHPDEEDNLDRSILYNIIITKTLSNILKTKEGMGEGYVIEHNNIKYLIYVTEAQVKVELYEGDEEDGTLMWVHLE